jgi:ribonuclease HI
VEVKVFTDGACSGNPGPGGWGAILKALKDGKVISEKEIYGGEEITTNNRMELVAAIKALESLKKQTRVTIITDSKYLKDGMTKWINNWLSNNWRNSANKEIKNIDLWKKINALSQSHEILWEWVKGHNAHEENDRADYLARLGMSSFKK